LWDDVCVIAQQEVQLARTEVAEKTAAARRNLTGFAIGAGIAGAGALLLLAALAILAAFALEEAGVRHETAVWLGPGLLGLVIGAIGAVLLKRASSHLNRAALMPAETIASFRENKEWMKEKLTHR
jgi:uncharacterized membrane protein SirB2